MINYFVKYNCANRQHSQNRVRKQYIKTMYTNIVYGYLVKSKRLSILVDKTKRPKLNEKLSLL